MDEIVTTDGTLRPGEYHPAADLAFAYLSSLDAAMLDSHMKQLATKALDGDRLAGVVLHSITSMISGQSIADRYILGAAWMIKALEEAELTNETPLFAAKEPSLIIRP